MLSTTRTTSQMKNFLAYSPARRQTAETAMQNAWFDDVRPRGNEDITCETYDKSLNPLAAETYDDSLRFLPDDEKMLQIR